MTLRIPLLISKGRYYDPQEDDFKRGWRVHWFVKRAGMRFMHTASIRSLKLIWRRRK